MMEIDRRIIEKRGRLYFFRLSEMERKQHNLMFLLMFVLFLTGFPLRFYGEWWAPRLYSLVGGPRWAPTIHRFAGLALTCLFLLHILMIVRNFIQNRMPLFKELLSLEMVPNLKDLREMMQHIMYLLYLKGSPPEYGRMTWREKIDYLALYVGIPVVAITGILLWQADIVTKLIPGIALNVAHLVHSYQATIILLSVVGFHWYNVHYSPDRFPMSHAFITGYVSEEEMVREHYEEYRESMKEAGLGEKIKNPDEIRPSGILEKAGYKLFSLVLILFYIWYGAVSFRYIFYSPHKKVETAQEFGFHSGIKSMGNDVLSGCVRCHTDVPHAESNEVMEPFLNMHASFLSCEACHMKGKDIVFRWYDPVAGKILERGGRGAKIMPGAVSGGVFSRLSSTVSKGERLLDRKNHRKLLREPVGCTECHKETDGYFPLKDLGYTVEHVSEINSAENLAFIERYLKAAKEERE